MMPVVDTYLEQPLPAADMDLKSRISYMKHNKLYHFTNINNIKSILQNGLMLERANGLLSKSDGLVYLTNSLKYIKIMAEEIAGLKDYAVITVDVRGLLLIPIWWRGKHFKEWATLNPIPKERIIKVRLMK